MSRLHVKKQSLIAVAGIVWLLAGLNVAQLGVRAAIGMRGVAAIILLAFVGGYAAICRAFLPLFSKLLPTDVQRIADPQWERCLLFRLFDRNMPTMSVLKKPFGCGLRHAGLFPFG